MLRRLHKQRLLLRKRLGPIWLKPLKNLKLNKEMLKLLRRLFLRPKTHFKRRRKQQKRKRKVKSQLQSLIRLLISHLKRLMLKSSLQRIKKKLISLMLQPKSPKRRRKLQLLKISLVRTKSLPQTRSLKKRRKHQLQIS